MTPPTQPSEESRFMGIGVLIFMAFCVFPALEMNGFGLGIPIRWPVALTCALVAGGISGGMIHPKRLLAGVVGGLIAGPAVLLAVQAYTQHRQTVHKLELVIVPMIACLPGVAVCRLLEWAMSWPKEETDDPDGLGSPDEIVPLH